MAEIEGETGNGESFFTNADGKKIFCRYWCEDLKEPRALVMINHGAGEHCLWYTPMAYLLKEAGCYVFAHDHVGHGQSDGDRVHVEDFHEYVRDSFQHFDSVAKRFPHLPKFVIGHSMGGAITIISAIERSDYFNGIILIAPAVIPDPATVSPLKVYVGKFLAHLCPQAPVVFLNPDYISRDKPTLFIARQLSRLLPQLYLARMDPWLITRNALMVLRYKDDPLVYHGGLKARWGASFLKWLDFVKANMKVLRCPLLTMHGTEDKLTHPDGSLMLVNRVSSTDKTLKMYEGYYHQLHYEPGEDGAEIRRYIVDWITTRLQ